MKFERRLNAAEDRMRTSAERVREALEAILLDTSKTLSRAQPLTVRAFSDPDIADYGFSLLDVKGNRIDVDEETAHGEIVRECLVTFDRMWNQWGSGVLPHCQLLVRGGIVMGHKTEGDFR